MIGERHNEIGMHVALHQSLLNFRSKKVRDVVQYPLNKTTLFV